ncbi:MAG: hypothetical protein Q7U04_02870 [Bacteriovorax sp.]|nr:hypothetical protein [Bacteriovorax sp.]
MSKKIYTGINIQWPISELILSGKKSIETRTYPIPEKYLNQDMLMIETPGKNGKFKARIVAIIKFTECIEYRNKKEFYNDSDKHFVMPDSEWAWVDKKKIGWKVTVLEIFKLPKLAPTKKGIVFTKNISN